MESEKKRKKKRRLILLLLLLFILLLGCGVFIYFYNQTPPPSPDLDEQAVDWEGKQELEQAGKKGSGETISIPCFESLVFESNQTTQKINLYNPENNPCYFVVSLIVEEDTLFKSEMIAPNTGFYEIELSKRLAEGEYSGMIIYECYALSDLSPMNGGSFHFNLTVK